MLAEFHEKCNFLFATEIFSMESASLLLIVSANSWYGLN